MDKPSKDQILSASSGWIATTLNFFPGLGSGYIYQRRWKPYFITLGAATAWFVLGIALNNNSEPTKVEQLIGIGGLLLISFATMIEAKIAHSKATSAIEEMVQSKKSIKRRGLFR